MTFAQWQEARGIVPWVDHPQHMWAKMREWFIRTRNYINDVLREAFIKLRQAMVTAAAVINNFFKEYNRVRQQWQ